MNRDVITKSEDYKRNVRDHVLYGLCRCGRREVRRVKNEIKETMEDERKREKTKTTSGEGEEAMRQVIV